MNLPAGILKEKAESESLPTGTGGSLSTETIFETLSNRRRRFVLHYLGQVDGPVTIRELSEQIAAWEHGIEVTEVSPKFRKRVYTGLHQTHLPKMKQLGIVEFDTTRGIVELAHPLEEFAIYLDVVAVDDIHWSHLYLSMGGAMTALVTLGALGI